MHYGIYILTSPTLYRSFNDCVQILYLELLFNILSHYLKNYLLCIMFTLFTIWHRNIFDHGCLDTFSAFRYENKLKMIKSNLKSGLKPIQQVAKRELVQSKKNVVLLDSDINKIFSKEHRDINENIYDEQFKKISVNNVSFEVNNRDSYFKTSEGKIGVLRNVIRNQDNIIFIGNIFKNITDFYTYSLHSSELGIVKVSDLSEERLVFSLNNIIAKCLLIPIRDEYVYVPSLHTMSFYK